MVLGRRREHKVMSNPSGRFQEDAVLAAARAVDGLEDFGDPAFREPLRVLLGALAEAPLNALGTKLLRGTVVRSLANRLRAEHWFHTHPEIADEVIAAPLVVVGMMRSGTTLIQRLLASDPRHACVLGWEALEPAPPLGRDWLREDPRIAAAEVREEQSRRFAPELFAIHPSYAHQAEEEIMFLADAFLSHVPEAYCDVPAYRAWLDTQDFAPAYRHLHRMLQLLQWQKRRRGAPARRFVLKTPAHLGYLDVLFATFPDAHVIHLHRDPLATVASGASLNTTLWRMHQDAVDPARVGRQWLERMAWTTARALAVRDLVENRRRFHDVAFGAAVSDPLGQIGRLYERLGIELTDDARRAMTCWLAADAREKRSAHRYAPGDFGLSADEVREVFADYTERYLSPNQEQA
jgi:hypothetical protein